MPLRNGWLCFLIERLKIASVSLILWVITVGGVFLLTPVWSQFVAVWNTPRELERISESLSIISNQLRELTGENRVVNIDYNASYVTEPVYEGEQVFLTLLAYRTALGRDCVLRRLVPLFTDSSSGIAIPGAAGSPPLQLGDTPTRLLLIFDVPDGVNVGRVGLSLSVEYLCDSQTIHEQTDNIYFILHPASNGN